MSIQPFTIDIPQAALETPELLVEDMSAFLRPLREAEKKRENRRETRA